MAAVTVKPIESEKEWEGFLGDHSEANFLQSWYWGEFHENLNHKVVRLGFFSGSKLIGIAQAVIEPARRGKHIVIAGGPILGWSNKQLVKTWASTIKQVAKDNGCVFVRVRPQLLDTSENQKLFKSLGFHTSPMHVTADLTSQLDLSKSDDDLIKSMRKGARYELNKSRKLGIKVESSTDDKFLKEFCELQLETARRQKFTSFSTKFLTEQFNAFSKADKVVMYRSTYEGKLLAMAFVIFYGQEAAYHYGASTELARKYPGAYIVQWEAIQEAKRRGCSRYNFWGVTEHGNTKHRFYGVSVFKRGFGGEDVAYLPARDLTINSVKYPVTYMFETARRKIRKL